VIFFDPVSARPFVMKMYHYFKIYKPYGMLSQFTDRSGRPVLKQLYDFPDNVYPVGRLDFDSEGLLLLTDDKSLNSSLLDPLNKTEKEYLVQVEGIPEEKKLDLFREGVVIEGRKTLPATAEIIASPVVPPRDPPIRYRKNVPDSWLKIIITEGRNRQVRKMCAKIGYPVLRLIRIRIKNFTLDNMVPGEVVKI